MANEKGPPPLLHNPNSPDMYAGEATGFARAYGNVKITFSSFRIDHSIDPGPGTRVVIGRLVMPLDAAEALAKGLLDWLEKLRAQAPVSEGPKTLQ